MQIHVGTSGYAYKEWKGSFYPKDLPAKQMLRYYGERFDCVEINASFYKLPAADTVKEWTTQVPEHFTFAMKAPQVITHFKRLKEGEVDAPIAEFSKVAKTLGGRLGPLLFQLPPNMKKDAARLSACLKLLKKQAVTFEFRHASWFDDEIFDMLRSHNVPLCLAEMDDFSAPAVATADWGYLRLRKTTYTGPALKKWAQWIQAQKWSSAQVFFMHEDTGTGPKFATTFLKHC